MAIPRKWYNEAVFYHIYPLGLTGAPKQNSYGTVEHRLNTLLPWIEHLKNSGITALYIGPLFESVGHGYETTDYKKVDSRLGDNADLKNFVSECHKNGIRVVLDGVFNHTGRDFFAFKDIKQNRENSVYKDWYCNVNFRGNNEYNDGFSYANWGGYNLLAKLNQKHPAVRDYLCDVVRFWVQEFDIDGIRLDAADVLDFSFMQALRRTADEVKPDFWLMGEVIHGDYNRWVNDNTLHSVTNYHLHKALYSGHNDHNYFEIAHTVKRLHEMTANGSPMQLYNFTDNHDVERIYTKLTNKTHFLPTHILLYTLPGVPSIYYGSEFGIEGKKERHSDDSLRPCLSLEELQKDTQKSTFVKIISRLGEVRKNLPALSYGDYKEVLLTNRQYAFTRNLDGQTVLVCVNNDDNAATLTLHNANGTYTGLLSGAKVTAKDGNLSISLPANSGEIFVCTDKKIEPAVLPQIQPIKAKKEPVKVAELPAKPTPIATVKTEAKKQVATPPAQPVQTPTPQPAPAAKPKADANEPTPDFCDCIPTDKTYEEMTIEQLQQVIFEKMKKNGPVTERMYKDIADNIWHNSLVNWAKSFG
ncbi:MAG: alpha-glucosidase C-terminal domain-containing protein [Clostridia bacterium]|nr:alpha-glucosidase C-terminal domain-containing protein [Clostridia bacterium]